VRTGTRCVYSLASALAHAQLSRPESASLPHADAADQPDDAADDADDEDDEDQELLLRAKLGRKPMTWEQVFFGRLAATRE